MLQCPDCNRTFLPGPLEKHIKICAKVFLQKRKEFDATKKRLETIAEMNDADHIIKAVKPKAGMAAAAAATSAAAKSGSKSAKWKEDSERFREAMKAARAVSHAQATGAPLPPPTISAPDPSLIQCPHCSRRFNDRAAERHIPQCKSIRAKPSTLKKGSGGVSKSTAAPTASRGGW